MPAHVIHQCARDGHGTYGEGEEGCPACDGLSGCVVCGEWGGLMLPVCPGVPPVAECPAALPARYRGFDLSLGQQPEGSGVQAVIGKPASWVPFIPEGATRIASKVGSETVESRIEVLCNMIDDHWNIAADHYRTGA
jgi:hypothetical protein